MLHMGWNVDRVNHSEYRGRSELMHRLLANATGTHVSLTWKGYLQKAS